jgi:DNA polymerase III subunit epsilon
LVDAAIVWSEPGSDSARLIVIENGEITVRASVEAGVPPPIPPQYGRAIAARHETFTLARFDRLRVLTTELKRLVAANAPVALRFGVSPALANERLGYALSWL